MIFGVIGIMYTEPDTVTLNSVILVDEPDYWMCAGFNVAGIGSWPIDTSQPSNAAEQRDQIEVKT
eukprot:gene16482-5039_t